MGMNEEVQARVQALARVKHRLEAVEKYLRKLADVASELAEHGQIKNAKVEWPKGYPHAFDLVYDEDRYRFALRAFLDAKGNAHSHLRVTLLDPITPRVVEATSIDTNGLLPASVRREQPLSLQEKSHAAMFIAHCLVQGVTEQDA